MPKKGQEGFKYRVPGQGDLVPNSRNPEPRGGGEREVLCYAQPLATVQDYGAPQSPLGSETPSSGMFVANRGGTTSPEAGGRAKAKDQRILTLQDGVRYPGKWGQHPCLAEGMGDKEDRR
jgi:hypothetical protein